MSRILGFVRDLVYAHVFGATAGTDAFFVAFKIPNFLRRLFAEGAFATAFVPVLTEFKTQRDYRQLKDFVDHTASSLGLVLLLVSLVGVLAAPVLVSVFAFGWVLEEQHAKLALSAEMLRLTFPYLFFISLTAFAGGVLNAHHKFAVPALTPVLLNLVLIACSLWLAPLMDEPIVALAWGVLIAGITQFAFQVPFLHSLKLLPSFRPKFDDPGVRRVLVLMVPALFAVSVTQINLLLDTMLASFLATGSISWLYYSDRLMEFPLGMLGVAMATVILPNLSRQHAEASPQEFRATLDWALRITVVFGAPAAVGLAALAGPLIATLFLSDVFTAEDVRMARLSLMAYASGLLAFIAIKVLAPGYYSRQDTKTPVKIAVTAMVANMALNLALIVPLQHAGLALATSLSAYLNAGLLLQGLMRRQVYRPDARILRVLVQTALACAVLAGLIVWAAPDLQTWLNASLATRIGLLLTWIAIGAGGYFLTLFAVGLRPRQLLSRS